MEVLQKQVLRALRRLFFHSWLYWLNWALLACFSICFVGLLIPKIWHIEWSPAVGPERWTWGWSIGSLVAALVVATWIAWIRKPSRLQAAVEIDQRYHLRERCSSALAIADSERQSPAGQALIQDAQKQVDRIDLRDHFPVRPAPQWAWILLPLAACIALLWVPDAQPSAIQVLANSAAKQATNVKNATEPILKSVQKKLQEAEDKGDLEAIDEYKRVEEQLKKLQNKPDLGAKEAIADLNEIKKEMAQKKESLGDSKQMKEAFSNLKDLDQGPAENLANSLQEGDFEEAKNDMEKLAQALQSGKLEPEQTDRLQKQFEQMKDSLEEARQKREGLIQEAKNELNTAQSKGDVEKTASLRKKLEKLQEGERMNRAMEKLQDQLEKAQKSMKSGDKNATQEAMQDIQKQLEELSEDQQAAKELEKMIEEIEDAKQSSKCEECDGQGCKECQNPGGKEGKKSSKSSNKSSKQGQQAGNQSGKQAGQKGGQQQDGQGESANQEGANQEGDSQEGDSQEGDGEMSEGEESSQEGKDPADKRQSRATGKNQAKGKGKGKGENQDEQPGQGEGEGRGAGDRDEKQSGFKEYDAQVRDKMRKGEMLPGQKVGGKNRKGLTREEVREAVKSSKPDAPDAIENIELPKAQRDQLREYFDSLRGGK
jgi:hypothetical protein